MRGPVPHKGYTDDCCIIAELHMAEDLNLIVTAFHDRYLAEIRLVTESPVSKQPSRNSDQK